MSNRRTILLVDDDQNNIQLLAAALKDEYDILTAYSGNEAISQLKHDTPDLILLDVMMPDMDGYDVCSSIKSDASFADIPVIFLTALDTLAGELLGLKLGGIDYISKPVNFDLLKMRIHNHLELKERNRLVKEQRDLLIRKNEALEAALARVKRLEGIIPICMHCYKIRCPDDSWQQFEKYISDHSDSNFSHGVCPDCIEAHYRKLLDENSDGKVVSGTHQPQE